MKLRIKGNTVRIRVTRSEVERLSIEGRVEQRTEFVNRSLSYALQSNDATDVLSATFEGDTITLFVQASLVKEWHLNNIVGFQATQSLPEGAYLDLLLEKDFVCKDVTTEDQSDQYDNPNELC